MAFYKSGERKHRPGLYMRLVNRGTDTGRFVAVAPEEPEKPELSDDLIVSYGSGVVTITLPLGSTVSYDGNGNVTISGLTSAAYDDEGNVTIGG